MMTRVPFAVLLPVGLAFFGLSACVDGGGASQDPDELVPTPTAVASPDATQTEAPAVEKPITATPETAAAADESSAEAVEEEDEEDGDAEVSEEDLRRAREASMWIDRGIANRGIGSYDEAIADYGKALALDASNSNAFYNRAIAKKAKGDVTGAIADYSETIKLNPQDSDAYFNRASIYHYDLNAPEKALADYTRSIDIKPSADAYTYRGVVRFARRDYQGAIADHTKAIELNPDYAVAYNHRGIARNAAGDARGSKLDYARALDLANSQLDQRKQ